MKTINFTDIKILDEYVDSEDILTVTLFSEKMTSFKDKSIIAYILDRKEEFEEFFDIDMDNANITVSREYDNEVEVLVYLEVGAV